MVFESADRLAVATRARSARSRRRCRPTASRSWRSSTSPRPRGSSTGCRTRSCGRSTASASARAGRSATSRSLSGNVKLAMSHVVPDLVQKVLKGQDPLHILGDGNQVRHYTYGGDLARGIVDCMERPDGAQRGLQPLDRRVDDRARAGRADLAQDQGRRRAASATCSDDPFEHDVQRRVPSTEKAKRRARLRGHHHARRRCSTRSSRGSSRPSPTGTI